MKLQSGVVYVLSGLPGSGKSTVLGESLIPDDMILSSDNMRSNILGEEFSIKYGRPSKKRREDANSLVFDFLYKKLELRCKEGLTSFIDTMALQDKDRKKFFSIAQKYNMPCKLLLFPEKAEECIYFDKNRDFSVGEDVINNADSVFQRTSDIMEVIFANRYSRIKMIPNTIPSDIELDIIGDVHGLYDNLVDFLENKLGYSISEDEITHSKGRKLLFLGDFIDRGPDSLKCIDLMMKMKESGHYVIIGNHENKLLKNLKKFKDGENLQLPGLSGLITLSHLLKRKESYISKVEKFLNTLPHYYVWRDYACVHAPLVYFEPLNILRSHAIYGEKTNDADSKYEKLYSESINKYKLVRGHIGITSEKAVPSVKCLEAKQAFGGVIRCLRDDEFIDSDKIEYDYNTEVKNKKKVALKKGLDKLVNKKIVHTKMNKMFVLYKYSKKVFYNNLWDEDKYLLKSRGIVMDLTGNIVQHPFDKIFNYLENDTCKELANNTEIIAIEKLNGFLGNISYDATSKDLLITTTGSFDSDFVNYIKSFINGKIKGNLIRFLMKNPMTLSFEVIHPDDPHIIQYEKKDMGLWLIGARGLNEQDQTLPEEDIDDIAMKLNFRRPKWFKTTFGEIKEIVRTSKIEGYMIRDLNNDYLCKFKTPYYLVTKFLSRMSDGNISFMFSNPEKFKTNIDEEFFDLVDIITKKATKDEFFKMDKIERRNFVQKIILSRI